MFEEIDVIKSRRVPLIYVCPPFCEAEFSSTSEPIIVLSPLRRRRGPTGLVVTNDGGVLTLTWGTVDGAICYNVYAVVGENYILVAECITDPSIVLDPGTYVVTVITAEGESDPSDPITAEGPGEVCLLRIVNYGSIEVPFFTGPATDPPPDSADEEWDGIWNFLEDPDAPIKTYWYKGSNEVFSVPFGVGPNIAVDGKAISYARITGPHAPGGPFVGIWWDVFILYEEPFVGSHKTWQGYKVGGDDTSPAGSYITAEAFFPGSNLSDPRIGIEIEFCEF